MLKAFIEWLLSLFAKNNDEEFVVEPIFNENDDSDDSHIILITQPETESNEEIPQYNENTNDNTYIINENDIMETQEILYLELLRKYICKDYTIGKLYIDGMFFSDTIEDTDRGLRDDMPIETIKKLKVYGETAIPLGTYEINMTYSLKFSNKTWGKRYDGNVPQIMNVKGYDGIRIHPMNTAADSLGCIGVGKNLEKGKILQSTEHYYKLLDEYIVPALNVGKRVIIDIKK